LWCHLISAAESNSKFHKLAHRTYYRCGGSATEKFVMKASAHYIQLSRVTDHSPRNRDPMEPGTVRRNASLAGTGMSLILFSSRNSFQDANRRGLKEMPASVVIWQRAISRCCRQKRRTGPRTNIQRLSEQDRKIIQFASHWRQRRPDVRVSILKTAS